MRMECTVEVKNFEQMTKLLAAEMSKVAILAVDGAAKEIMEKSREEVPRDTSTLANDTFVSTDAAAGFAQANFGYAGNKWNEKQKEYTRDYAVEVHEDLTANHPVGKAKYLEDPVMDWAYEGDEKLGTIIKQAIGGL